MMCYYLNVQFQGQRVNLCCFNEYKTIIELQLCFLPCQCTLAHPITIKILEYSAIKESCHVSFTCTVISLHLGWLYLVSTKRNSESEEVTATEKKVNTKITTD